MENPSNLFKIPKVILGVAIIISGTVNVTYSQSDNKKEADNQTKTVLPNGKVKQKSNDRIFAFVEQQPEFPGGREAMKKFITGNLVHPKTISDQKITGRVFTSFVINQDGSLQDVTVIRGLSPEHNQEAIRIVNLMPKWKPAMQSGAVVRLRYIVPVEFY